MSEQQSIRDELAATIHENFNACRGRNGVSPSALADRIMASPVIRRIQAEVLRDAANWKRNHNLGDSVWGDYLIRLAHEKYQAGGDDMITIWLNDRADRIERGE